MSDGERHVDPATGEISTVAQTAEIIPDVLPTTTVLEGLRDGQVLEEVGEALRELNQLVLLHQAKGTLTLTLTVNPQPNDMVLVQDEVVMKPPKTARPSTLRYVDKVGNLKAQNPSRPTMDGAFREITQSRQEPREI